MHTNQFWWAWSLRFRSYVSFCLPSKTAKISLRTMGYSPWGQRIEPAQKIHASRS